MLAGSEFQIFSLKGTRSYPASWNLAGSSPHGSVQGSHSSMSVQAALEPTADSLMRAAAFNALGGPEVLQPCLWSKPPPAPVRRPWHTPAAAAAAAAAVPERRGQLAAQPGWQLPP